MQFFFKTPITLEEIMSFATKNLWLQALSDYMYDFNHKLLL